MIRRQGATLVEVLVAIFVMAIGLLALLTLFPLGALRMAQAIQDTRCAQAATTATALLHLRNIRTDPGVVGNDSFNTRPAPYSPVDPQGPSYPVFVDPYGFRQSFPPSQTWVGIGNGNDPNIFGRIQRCTTSFTLTNTDIYRWFTSLDDINFNTDPLDPLNPAGSAKVLLPGTATRFPLIERDSRFTWAYLLQRPCSSDVSNMDFSVVVFNKRSLNLTTNLTLAEAAYQATFDPTRNTVTIDYAGFPVPPVAARDWILDASYVQRGAFGSAHGFFYRVVGVTEVGPTALEYEVQAPLRGFSAPTLGTMVVIDGIAEVYEKGLGRKAP